MEKAFRLSSECGYDGIEIMVSKEEATRSPQQIKKLSKVYNQPILSIHSPVLVMASFVFGIGPRNKLRKSVELAEKVGADTVVVHPPYFFQPVFGLEFENFVNDLEESSGITIAVENVFNVVWKGKQLPTFIPGWNPGDMNVNSMTLDFSHSAYQKENSLDLAKSWGDKLKHIHLCDGTGNAMTDEHLVPGRGTQPVAETLEFLAGNNFSGHIVAEIHTETYSKKKRKKKMEQTLEFARKHFETK